MLNIILAVPFVFLLVDNDPINASGQWALIYLLLTTSVTVLQKQFKILAVQYRKTIGLWAAGMVAFHLLHYFREGGIAKALREIFYDYQLIGWVSVTLLILMTLTSHKYAQKKLGKNWAKLHLAIYLVIGLAIIHGTTATKLGWYTTYPFAIAAGIIFFKKTNRARIILAAGMAIAYTLIAIPNPSFVSTNPISEWDECLIGPPNHCENKTAAIIDATLVSISCINGKHVAYFADGRRTTSDKCLDDITQYEIRVFERFKTVPVTSRIFNDVHASLDNATQ